MSAREQVANEFLAGVVQREINVFEGELKKLREQAVKVNKAIEETEGIIARRRKKVVNNKQPKAIKGGGKAK